MRVSRTDAQPPSEPIVGRMTERRQQTDSDERHLLTVGRKARVSECQKLAWGYQLCVGAIWNGVDEDRRSMFD